MKIVKIYLMQEDNNGKSLKALNDCYISSFCKTFGGCTTYAASGFWYGDRELYKDKALVCEIFVDTTSDKWLVDDKELKPFFIGIAKQYKRDAKQEAVSLVVDGEALIIE